jgi:hypothetical protein
VIDGVLLLTYLYGAWYWFPQFFVVLTVMLAILLVELIVLVYRGRPYTRRNGEWLLRTTIIVVVAGIFMAAYHHYHLKLWLLAGVVWMIFAIPQVRNAFGRNRRH